MPRPADTSSLLVLKLLCSSPHSYRVLTRVRCVYAHVCDRNPVQHKANINRVAQEQLSPFEVAVKQNNVDIVKLLIDCGCNPANLPVGRDAPVLSKVCNHLQRPAVMASHRLTAAAAAAAAAAVVCSERVSFAAAQWRAGALGAVAEERT